MASNVFYIHRGEGTSTAPQGVDGRYIYIAECLYDAAADKIENFNGETSAVEFELIVGDFPPVIVRRYDEIDLLEFAQQDRILRLRNLSAGMQKVIIYSSAIPFSKKRETFISAGSVVGLEEGSVVGIDTAANGVTVLNEITQDAAQHQAKISSLKNISDGTAASNNHLLNLITAQNTASEKLTAINDEQQPQTAALKELAKSQTGMAAELKTSIAHLTEAQDNMALAMVDLPQRMADLKTAIDSLSNSAADIGRTKNLTTTSTITSEAHTITNAVSFSVVALTENDYTINATAIPYSITFNADEVRGAQYNGIIVSGKNNLILITEIKEAQ